MHRALCLVFCALLAGGAGAQPYPSKPVRIVVPASPGGASDLVGRLLATQLSEMLGQPFIVENRVTSGGIVGTQQVAESAPDGHTLLVTFDTFASNALLFKNLKWDPIRDFAPVMQLCRYPQVLLVHPSLGVRTVKEFVALAKERGPQLNYASAGPASSSRLAYELFKDVAGIDTVPVHYKGGGPAIQDLLPGRVPLVSTVVTETLPYIRSGKVKPIAVTGSKRSPSLPDVPAVGETLPKAPSGTALWALLARAGTPDALINLLNADVVKALQSADVRERMSQMDVEPVGSSPARCDAFLREQVAVWGKLVKASGARVE